MKRNQDLTVTSFEGVSKYFEDVESSCRRGFDEFDIVQPRVGVVKVQR